MARGAGKCWRAGRASSRRDGAAGLSAPFARLPHEACLGSSGYCRTVCGCGVRPGAQVQQGAPPPSAPPADAPVAAAPRDTLGPAVPPAHPVRRPPSRPASRSSDRVAQSIEPPGAQPRLRRKSARLRTVGGIGAYLCAATPMVPAAGAVSLAVPADAVVSATDVVPTTRVVAASPLPSADRRYSA